MKYIFEVSNRNTRKRYEIRPKLTIKTPKRVHFSASTRNTFKMSIRDETHMASMKIV